MGTIFICIAFPILAVFLLVIHFTGPKRSHLPEPPPRVKSRDFTNVQSVSDEKKPRPVHED